MAHPSYSRRRGVSVPRICVYGQPEVSAHLRTRTRDVDVLIGRCVFGPKGSNVLARSTGELHSLLRQADPALGRAR